MEIVGASLRLMVLSAKGSLYKVDGEGVHGSGRVVVGLDNWGWAWRVSGVIFSWEFVRSTPLPVTVTTRIITFLVGDPYKPSFATVTGRGVDPRNSQLFWGSNLIQIYG